MLFRSIIGEEIQLKPVPSFADNLQIAYYTKLPALSATNTTNWLTANAANLLMYASLLEAEAFLVNDPRIPVWKTAYDEAIQDFWLRDWNGRHSGSALEVRT